MKCAECSKDKMLWWTPIGNLCVSCLTANSYTLDLKDPGDKTPLPDGSMVRETIQ